MKQGIRILTMVWIGVLLAGMPVSAARMDSIDISGSDATYQAEYEAYTKAASAGDAAVCELTVGNPEGGENGALCRIELPDDTVYLYMDEGDLAVLTYDGSKYKKFKVNYQLKRDVTYTLCVFQDGLAFFDGTDSYTYSGDFSGFTDIMSGWSAESNVFETTLTRRTQQAGTAQQTASQKQTDAEAAAAAADAQSTRSRPSGWVIAALILAISGNVIALIALRVAVPVRRTPAKHAKRGKRPAPSPKPRDTRDKPKPVPPRPPKPQKPKPQQTEQQPVQPPQSRTAEEKLKDYASVLGSIATDSAQLPAQPFDLYTDSRWRASRRAMLKPHRFGDPGSGLCTFVAGHDLVGDPFILLDRKIWLNPVRFRLNVSGEGVPLSTAEASGITIAFDFYRVNTSEREIVVLEDVEMVNFRPAKVKETEDGILELAERGIIVFAPVKRTVKL